MNIHELDSYDLGDAVKFNDKLNPRIWGANEKMRPEVLDQLRKIADDFREFLGIDVEVKDITVSGSNAAYTYTPHSDIDLHLVVDLPEADRNEVYRELFDAKKYAYNDQHNIKIGDYDVELYVQDANKRHHSQGIYSIKNDDWVSVPKRRRPDVDDISVKSKFEDLGHRIESAIDSGDFDKITAMAEKLRDYRQAGLDAHGEFGPENLAFKILRTQGLIEKLYAARNAAKDQLLSLDERKKKRKRKVKYGYGAYWYPGTAYAGQDHPAGTEGGDGGDGGGESLREDHAMPSDEDILRDFIDFCVKELKIEQMPRVKLRRDPQWPAVHKTFGRYDDEAKTLEVAWGQRHIMDVLRTVAHELTHKHQHEREGEKMGPDAGETGSPYENEANAKAGVLMRDYGRLHPEYFSVGQATDLNEEEKVYGIAGFKVIVKDGYFYIYKGPDLIYRSVAPRTYTRDQLIKQVERAVTMTGATVKQSGTRAKPKYGIEDAYKRLLQIITYRVDRGIDIDPETIRKEIATIVNDYKVTEKDLRKKWAQTKPYKYSKTPELFAPYSRFYKYFSSNSNTPWSELYQVRRDDKYYQWLDQQMKNWMQKHGLAVTESASGYIPTKAQANDPRYSMALTVDIKPGQVGKEANKLKLKTDRQGHPQIARANGLFENLYREYKQFKAAEDYSPDNPPGPEFKPTMPAGTLRVDVSDVYDWYKLGQHISRMKGLGQHDFGKGPPSTIISFGDEDTEHEFIGDIQATGLDVTDIDPADPKKRPGKTVKTDPTYNVNEFAPGPDSGDGQGPDYITQLANRWWNAADTRDQKRIADVIRTFGYEITQVESEDDAVQLTDITGKADPIFISADEFDPDLFESSELDEVKMSPGALEKFATSDAAKGIRAGFEAELIFRDTQGESEELDPEPNYDADERAYSISQVVEFFANDEYGYGMSERQQERLYDELDEKYMEWYDEQMTSDFSNDAEDLIRERLLEETPLAERIHIYLTDSLQKSDEEADRIIKAGADAPRFTKSADQEAYAAENPEYETYLEAADAAEQELEESVEYSVRNRDEYWDEAIERFREDYQLDDDSGFFSDVGMRWMSDVANEFNLDWPVWDGGGQQNYGSRSWDDIGNELAKIVDMPVVVSSDYHSTKRRPGQWIIEPDGSLDPDDKGEEAGLEIVSPPMPLLTAIEKLKAVVDWANDPNGGNAYTNSSTGLHMGVSLPHMKSEGKDDDTGIDYVKLILFLGDQYVLEKFGRQFNTYTASALERLKQNIKGKKSDPAGVVKLLQHGLTELAYRELQKGVGTSKYTSAHIKPGYIEFRSPGGDWLAKADEEIGVLENTMLRFARAMAIAGDPNAERQEYAKKLYKLVTTDNPEYADQLRLFSEFSAGTINKEQLKKQWADTVLQKELPSVGKNEYEVYSRDNDNSPDATVATLYAKDYDDAYDQFLKKYGRDINNLDVRVKQPWFDVFDDSGRIVKTIRARDIETATDRAQYEFGERWTDTWNIYRRPDDTPEPKASPRAQVAKRIATKPKAPLDYNYDIIDQRTLDLKAIDRFYAANDQEASRVFDQWLRMKNLPNDTANYGYRRSAKTVSDDQASDWEAVHQPTGRVLDTLAHADPEQAVTWRDSVMRDHGITNYSNIIVRRVGNQQAADARRDSVDLQRNLGVRDVDIDVTQNFDPSAYERNSDRIDAIRARAQQPRQNYELVQHDDTDRVIHRMNDATADEVRAWIDQQEREGMPAGFLRTRIVAESTGQHDDEQTRTALDMAAVDFNYKNWADVEMRGSDEIKTAIQRHAVTKLDLAQRKPFNMLGKSAIVKGVAQADRDLIDKQIATARKLGDDVNENFADKKVSGKSRPGRVKRAGASCKGSVTDLRARAKKYSGEKAKMYHWCANMKSGRKK